MHKLGLNIDAGDPGPRCTGQQRQGRRTAAGANIQYAVAILGRYAGGQQDRIDGGAKAPRRLQQGDPAIQDGIFADPTFGFSEHGGRQCHIILVDHNPTQRSYVHRRQGAGTKSIQHHRLNPFCRQFGRQIG